ncbi:unnamed protein product [Periconia digitata]|uniref:Uncharacterized protein n=1 Tax=Periconia digitata TaxID=1303443 RepID=A0A9W4UNM8_9PLEO|nr:unnamed protein product [Periconia digitata]
MSASSCTYADIFPKPPTSAPSCAVRVGGANATILDTCCNGEVNLISTYATPGSSSDCYQYCNAPDVSAVQSCLGESMNMYGVAGAGYQCFNAAEERSVGSGGLAIRFRRESWLRKFAFGAWIACGILAYT